MKTLHLNVFTNCGATSPSPKVLRATLRSLKAAFGLDITPGMTIYCDPKPHISRYAAYCANLRKMFPDAEVTSSHGLADGYLHSVRHGTADYLFQLEHDWEFLAQNIMHDLPEIIDLMEQENLPYLRFAKNRNVDKEDKWQTFMRERHANGINYCLTDNISNNPHIIDRQFYLENVLHLIDGEAQASYGIEQRLEKGRGGFIGAVYGGIDYPATIRHLDGRKGEPK